MRLIECLIYGKKKGKRTLYDSINLVKDNSMEVFKYDHDKELSELMGEVYNKKFSKDMTIDKALENLKNDSTYDSSKIKEY